MHTERGLDRLVNFSDAVVAIAITLLVLPLVELPHDLATEHLGDVLHDSRWVFFGFFLSFVVIASFWRGHHAMFEQVRDYDARIVWLNLLWLLTIVVMPFTTALIVDTDQSREGTAVNAVYLLNLTASSLLLAVMDLVIRHSPTLRRSVEVVTDEGESRVISRARDDRPSPLATLFVQPALFAVATVVATTVPAIGMWATFVLFLNAPINALVRRLSPGREPAGSAR